MKLLLGIDYGTGGCKVTVLDETGAFVAEASTEFTTYHDHPGWSEQEPADWWKALVASLGKLAAKGVDLQRVAALALDGSTHNAVLLARADVGAASDAGGCDAVLPDRPFRPIRRTIMWTDQRATAECAALKAGWGEKIFSTCYQMPAPTWTLPQLMWLKANEPGVLKKVDQVLFVKDYVRYLLTGVACTDYIEAQGTLMYQMPGAFDTVKSPSALNGPSALESACGLEISGGEAAFNHFKPEGQFNHFKPEGRSNHFKPEGRFNHLSGEAAFTDLGSWDPELVALAGLKLSAMPRIVRPTDVVGRVTADAAAATGLPEGVPVVCGTSDSAVEDYGAGAVEPGDLIIKLATAGNVNAMTAEAHPHPKTLTYSHVVPGMWYSVSATNAAALCMRWMRDAFYEIESPSALNGPSALESPSALNGPSALESACGLEISGGETAFNHFKPAGQFNHFKPEGQFNHFKPEGRFNHLKPEGRFNHLNGEAAFNNLYALMDAEASASSVGANGVFFHPYLQGERCPYWDANLRASFTGVSISSTRGDFVRALMEGVAYSLRDCYRTLEEMKLPVKRIFLIGGGARSKLWSEIVANVFNCTVAVPTPADASFGSCLLAGVGIGIFPGVKAAVAKCLKIDREIVPDPVVAAKYDRLFTCYRRIHDALEPVYRHHRCGEDSSMNLDKGEDNA